MNRDEQGLWESTHLMSIHSEQLYGYPDLSSYFHQLKNRRYHAVFRWKAVLHVLFQGTIQGQYGLDVLLDPVFF